MLTEPQILERILNLQTAMEFELSIMDDILPSDNYVMYAGGWCKLIKELEGKYESQDAR